MIPLKVVSQGGEVFGLKVYFLCLSVTLLMFYLRKGDLL